MYRQAAERGRPLIFKSTLVSSEVWPLSSGIGPQGESCVLSSWVLTELGSPPAPKMRGRKSPLVAKIQGSSAESAQDERTQESPG